MATEKKRKDIQAEITANIIELMESGVKPWAQPWKHSGNWTQSIPNNPFTKRNYSGVNVLVLWMERERMGYESNSWATFNQIRKAGGMVRKGEHGRHVVFWKSLTVKDGNGNDEKGGENGKLKQILFARQYTVFNTDQCDGLEIPAPKPPPECERIERAEEYIRRTGSVVEHGGNRACYSSGKDFIQMPFAGDFKSPELYYSVSLHEHTHWTGHESRCKREFGKRFGSEAYAFEELVAEMGSAFVCASLGLKLDLGDHAAYLDNWIQILKNDKKALFHACGKAAEAHRYLDGLQGTAEEEDIAA